MGLASIGSGISQGTALDITFFHNYDSLIRFFLLCSYSDLYIYNLDQEYNPYFVIKREDLYGTNI